MRGTPSSSNNETDGIRPSSGFFERDDVLSHMLPILHSNKLIRFLIWSTWHLSEG